LTGETPLGTPLVITYTGIVFERHNDTKDLSFAACIMKSASTRRGSKHVPLLEFFRLLWTICAPWHLNLITNI